MENEDDNPTLNIQLATGTVVIELFPDLAPLHVERIVTLAREGAYDNVAFHRVIDDFVAQTGDVQFGDLDDGYDPGLVGFGGSDLPDLPAEFSDTSFETGIVGMARSTDPDSANSQFFIMLGNSPGLDGDFTVVGEVQSGQEFVEQIKLGTGGNGEVTDPDRMIDVFADTGDGIGLGLSEEEVQEIALLYEAGLDREGDIDLPGLNFWIDAREGGFSMRQLADAFLLSDEFNESFGEPFDTEDPRYLEDEAFVRVLYENVLDREADQGGLDFWRSVLDRPDFDRQDLLLAFSASIENVEGSPEVETLSEVGAGDWAFLS